MKLTENQMNSQKIRSADLVIDIKGGLVEKRGQELVMADLTWRCFRCLVLSSGKIVAMDELIAEVWGESGASNETVAQRIKLLRKALGDDSQNPRYVSTVRNRGFRWTPSVEPYRRPPSSAMLFGPGVLGLILVGLALAYLILEESPTSPETEVERLIARGNDYAARLRPEDNQIAISMFKEAQQRDPKNRDLLLHLSFALTHNATKFNYPLSSAIQGEQLAREALTLSNDAAGHHALGFALDAQGEIDAALEHYELALELQPNNAAILGSAAYLYQVRGELDKALEYGLRSNTFNNAVPFNEVQLASVLHLLEEDAAAADWLAQGLLLKPDNVFIYSAKAEIQFAHGHNEAALETIQQAEQMGINRPELHILHGLTLYAAGDLTEAVTAFQLADEFSGARESGKPYLLWLGVLGGDAEAINEARTLIEQTNEGSQDPAHLLVIAGLLFSLREDVAALEKLDCAISAGYRDWRKLSRHPMFLGQRDRQEFVIRLDRIRALIQVAKRNSSAS